MGAEVLAPIASQTNIESPRSTQNQSGRQCQLRAVTSEELAHAASVFDVG